MESRITLSFCGAKGIRTLGLSDVSELLSQEIIICGAEEIRTLDLYVANVPLSQLSYSPILKNK